MSRRTLPILLLLVMSLTWTASASARKLTVYDQMLIEYVDKGRLSACKYSAEALKTAKGAISEDYEQYGGSLIAALDDAIAARAQGQCDPKKQGTSQGQTAAPPVGGQAQPPPPPAGSQGATTAPPGAQATAPPATPGQAQEPPKPVAEAGPAPAISTDNSIALAARTGDVSTDAPFPLLLLAILGGLLALGAVMFAVARWFAWEPAWSVRFRHAAGEAGWRASSTFAEFTDFVRLGR